MFTQGSNVFKHDGWEGLMGGDSDHARTTRKGSVWQMRERLLFEQSFSEGAANGLATGTRAWVDTSSNLA